MHALYPATASTAAISNFTDRLADAAAGAPLDTPVPTCGEWDLAELVWHLTQVQHFWAHVIEHRPDGGPESYDRPDRPGDEQLVDALRAANADLVGALSGADSSEPAWSWSSDQTVGFTIRRQTHEAFVHMVDGLLATGTELPPVSTELGADGIDEMLTHMIGGMPPWASFTSQGAALRVETTDTGDAWTVEIGRLTGTEPQSQQTYDIWAVLSIDQPSAVATTLRGKAVDLNLWCWGRVAHDAVQVAGVEENATALREYVTISTQ